MFYYLGRKYRLAKLYPEPTHPTIVEPFAGSAAYSLHGDRWQRDVVLVEKDPDVCDVWRYLLAATPADIDALPDLRPGDRLSAHAQLSNGEAWLIRFAINTGASQRSDVVTRFNRWGPSRRYVRDNLHKIKHWTLIEGDYTLAPDISATWFVDPPYHQSGRFYRTSGVDHDQIGRWTERRAGQVIACEQAGAAWLPFLPLVTERAARGRQTGEVVYLRSA